VGQEALCCLDEVVAVAGSGVCDVGVDADVQPLLLDVEVERTVGFAGGYGGPASVSAVGWTDYTVFEQAHDDRSYRLLPFQWVDVLSKHGV
jgi:hypothetical protein